MIIDNFIKKFINRFSKADKIAFFSAFFGGLIIHLFIYTNIIPNFDGVGRVYDAQQMTVSGRWFLHYVSCLNFFTQMPVMIGILTVSFIGFFIAIVVHLLEIHSCTIALFSGILAVSFPSMAYINTYTFTSSAYAFAIFLTVVAVWMATRWKWGWVPAGVLLSASIGTYQAYVSVAITLCVLLVFKEVLYEEKKLHCYIEKGLRYIIFICWGTLLYYLILKIFLYVKQLKLLSYLGMDAVESGYPIRLIGSILKRTYNQVIDFFFLINADNSFNNIFIVFINWIFLFFCFFVLVIYIIKIRMQIMRIAVLFLLAFLMPLAVNFCQVLSPYSEPTPVMKYAFVIIYFGGLMLADNYPYDMVKRRVINCIPLMLILLISCCSIYFVGYDNVLYTMLAQAHRTTQVYAANMLSRIESLDGYRYGMEVVIVGGFPDDRYFSDIDVYGMVQQGGALANSVVPLNRHIYYYFNDWLNVPFIEPDEEVFVQISNMPEFKEMPLYPDDGSVRIINNKVVVKVQSSYLPKVQYEKDYEKRR